MTTSATLRPRLGRPGPATEAEEEGVRGGGGGRAEGGVDGGRPSGHVDATGPRSWGQDQGPGGALIGGARVSRGGGCGAGCVATRCATWPGTVHAAPRDGPSARGPKRGGPLGDPLRPLDGVPGTSGAERRPTSEAMEGLESSRARGADPKRGALPPMAQDQWNPWGQE